MNHKSGFVSIIGRPNVGKSTLMNALVGERISIITPKVQTTRHRIMGILNAPEYQIVFSDTPGIIEPKYKLHSSMMDFVNQSLQDADLVIFITDSQEEKPEDESIYERLRLINKPILVLLNKIDLLENNKAVEEKVTFLKNKINALNIIPVSALNKFGLNNILSEILKNIPINPPYFPKDQITDKSERFIASEIIREKILMRYKEEIPYSVQVDVVEFKEEEKLIRISAEIYVMRDSQKQILIGKGGIALKNVGIAARRELEQFFRKQVFLKTFVKVKENWRDSDKLLKQFGYKEE
ncbi:MAG: GTPase Era [Bacteroidia bacterium]|nr:GTPase Era [Bacteroidia bacterium]